MGQTAAGQNEMTIRILSGETQSQELFDFSANQNRQLSKERVVAQSAIVYAGEDILYKTCLNPEDEPAFLLNVPYPGKVQLQRLKGEGGVLWRVLKQGEAYPLEPGSQVKIGKVKFRLREIVQEQKQKTEKDFNFGEEVGSVSEKSHVKEEQCRICFDTSDSKINPLVCLCNCSGSVKYTHFECLKDWIANHVTRRQSINSLFYSYMETKCEICKAPFEPEFVRDGKKYVLLSLENAPNPPYAVFESVEIIEQEGRRKFSISMVGLGDDEITIGRNSSSSLVMKEISVSRNHCALSYRNRQLLIRDKNSKFGTLIRLPAHTEFSSRQGLWLQFESKLIQIQQQQGIDCCCVQSDIFVLQVRDQKERQ